MRIVRRKRKKRGASVADLQNVGGAAERMKARKDCERAEPVRVPLFSVIPAFDGSGKTRLSFPKARYTFRTRRNDRL